MFGLSPFSKYQFTNLLIYLSRVQRFNVLQKLGSIPTRLAYPGVVPSCFACLVFRIVLRPFEATKKRSSLNVIRELKKPRRQRQRERRQTKCLICRTIAVHVRYKYLNISLPFSAKQQREMTKFRVFWRT